MLSYLPKEVVVSEAPISPYLPHPRCSHISHISLTLGAPAAAVRCVGGAALASRRAPGGGERGREGEQHWRAPGEIRRDSPRFAEIRRDSPAGTRRGGKSLESATRQLILILDW